VPEFSKIRSVANTFANQVQSLSVALTGYGDTKTKRGLAIFVKMPYLQGDSTKLGSLTSFLVCEVSVCESRLYNANVASGFAPAGIGFHADDVAENLALFMQNWRDTDIADAVSVSTILSDHEGWIPPDLRDGSEKFDLYVTAFQMRAVYSQAIQTTCFPPTIAFSGTGGTRTVTLTARTAGSTMYYGTGTDYPLTAYTVPFSVAVGVTVTSVATKTGLRLSDIEREVAA